MHTTLGLDTSDYESCDMPENSCDDESVYTEYVYDVHNNMINDMD